MKFTFEQKLTAVKLHKEKGTYKYPKGYEAKSKKQVYRFYVQFWEAQYDRNGEEGIRHELNSAYSPEKKLSIITPVLMGEITGRQQAIRCGVRPSSIVLWIKRYRKDGLEGLKSCHPGRKPKIMPIISEKKEDTGKTVAEDNQEDLKKKVEELEHENLLLHAELDYRKKIGGLGREETKVRACEKADAVVFFLQGEKYKGKVKLAELLSIEGLQKSSYEYAVKAKDRKKPEKLDDIRIKDEIRAIWLRSKKRYGYRKIAIELRSRYSENVNHKKVLRMMHGMDIYAKLCGHDKCYSSYKGRVGKIAENILQRDFTANGSLQKAGTDVTEFKCSWGKAYLSPVIDFYNDEILSYSISESPSMKMVMDMLDEMHRREEKFYPSQIQRNALILLVFRLAFMHQSQVRKLYYQHFQTLKYSIKN